VLITAEYPPRGTVEGDTASAIGPVRLAIGRILAQLPGKLTRAVDLQRCLGVDYKLCWQMFEVLRGEDPLVSGRHLPSMVSVRKFTAAAVARGASLDVVEPLHEAVAAFHGIVRTHASDRTSFNNLLAAVNRTDDSEVVSAQNRRAAFRSEAQIWGAQVGTYFSARLVRRSAVDPHATDTCGITLKADFQRFRPEVRPVIFGQRGFDAAGQPVPREFRPLDPRSDQVSQAPVLPEFCTNPLPRCQIVRSKDGWIRHVLDTDVLGRTGLVDLAYGTLTQNAPLGEVPERNLRLYYHSLMFVVPTERAVHEVAVHRPSLGRPTPRSRVFSDQLGDHVTELLAEESQFLVPAKVVALGPADQVVPPAEVKNYGPMMAYAFEASGWDPREFDVYRVTTEYPILHTTSSIWFPVT
jgi:hypothetical protein